MRRAPTVLCAAAGALAAMAPAAQAAFPGANGRIAFGNAGGGSYTILADGTDRRPLGSGQVLDPKWSADGRRVAFSRFLGGNSELFAMSADGSAGTRLTDSPAQEFQAAWSPDGKSVAFTKNEFGGFDIYAMAADGSSVRRLTGVLPAPAFTNSQPAWSPDGTAIAFESARTGEHDIFRMAADGSGQTNLTNTPGSSEMIPSWSPDGTKLAYQRSQPGSGNIDVFVMSATGGAPVQLTESLAGDVAPAWSPDGSKIAFQTNRDGRDEIYVMNADGSNETRLTFDGGNTWPDWQPLPPSRITKADCKQGGFAKLGFKNQGRCIAFAQGDRPARP